MIKKTIPTGAVRRQLIADLTGKDSYRGVTLTYAWLANQFGHFGLGFIPTAVICPVLQHYFSAGQAAFWAATAVSFGWTVFELCNLLLPLLLSSRKRAGSIALKTYTFTPAWGNVVFDTVTDIGFFCAGAFAAGCILGPAKLTGAILVMIALLLVMPSRYWYHTKLFLQTAQYPFQFRLSQWNSSIDDSHKETIRYFLRDRSAEKHILVFGGPQSGKTLISVGMATERSIQHETCSYTTANKLYSMCFEPDNPADQLTSEALWTWRTASVLVIDDINPDVQANNDLVTPDEFLRMLDGKVSPNPENRELIRNKNVIWVMGNEDSQPALQQRWRNMLLEIGVADKNILYVML